MDVNIVTTREDSMKIIAELSVLLAYVKNEAILEFIFLYHGSKHKQTKSSVAKTIYGPTFLLFYVC